MDTDYLHNICGSNERKNRNFDVSEISIDDFFPERRLIRREIPHQGSPGFHFMEREQNRYREEENLANGNKRQNRDVKETPRVSVFQNSSPKQDSESKTNRVRPSQVVLGELRTPKIRF